MKKSIVLVILFLTICFHASNALPQAIEIIGGFVFGGEFLKLSEDKKSSYVIGVIDGFFGAPMFGAKDKNKELEWLYACVEKRTKTQISDILTKYLKDNPKVWELPTHASLFNALKTECGK